MEYKVSVILVLCFAFLIPSLMLQAQTPLKAPTTVVEAQALFAEGWELERQQKYDEALARYTLLISSMDSLPSSPELNRYRMAAFNNIGGIQFNDAKYQEAIATFKSALEFAAKVDDYSAMSEYYHKLGIIYSQFSILESQRSPLKTSEGKKLQQSKSLLLNDGTYVRMGTTDEEIGEERIRLRGSQHPTTGQTNLYNKLVNLKITGDFNPNELLVPDLVSLQIKIEKKGYYGVVQPRVMLPDIDYTEVEERLLAKQRQVDAQITEDFYRSGPIPPDEITLTSLDERAKTVPITDKQKFPPGKYRLDIKRRGYEPITENVVIVPGEEPYVVAKELKSSLRNVTYKIQGDFDARGSSVVEPDEINLNTLALSQNMPVKPGEYKLVIRKEGYEPIMKTRIIEPNNQPYPIVEYMKTLPREVLFQITSDYQKDELLTPDEISLNGRNIKYGESVKPSRYNVTIRKRGYDTYNNETIIDPKADPYILSAMLKSTPRRVILEITTQFPEGQKLNSDRYTCTLNNQPCTGDQSFKPGEYEIVIKSAGYEDVVKKIKIIPDEAPYVHREILKPKLVEINTAITQDVEHDNPEIKPTLTLINEKSKEVQVVKHGDKIAPGIYLAKIEMDGYETSLTKESIMPSEQPYKIAARLSASMRKVIPRIIAEYPEGEMLQVFDYITLGGKTITKDFQIKPGMHEVIIRKEGYIDIQKNIRIFANSMEYLLVDNMQTKPRLVTFLHLDNKRLKEIVPDTFSCSETLVTTKSITLKPGPYNFKGQTKGYALVDINRTIPVGSTEYPIKVEWIAVEREVITTITTDYEREKGETIPDVMKLNDLMIGKKSNVRPDRYTLLIKKEGYETITEPLNIEPAPEPYEIKRELKSIPRTVTTIVMSAYGNTPIDPPDSATRNGNPLNRIETKPGVFSFVEEVKPGTHKFMVQHKGYQLLEEEILVETSKTKELEIVLTVYPLPVKVGYEILGYKDQPVMPDEITLDGTLINETPDTEFSTGRHSLVIRAAGYKTIEEDIEIDPREEPYIIKRNLEPVPRDIEPYIIADYSGDTFTPEIMTLNTLPVDVNSFMPGEYTLEIQNPGYTSIKEVVEIEPSPDLYRIERTMVSKPRLVKEKVIYDIPPPEKLPPHKITIALLDKPEVERVIKDGDTLKPGTYLIKVNKQAYEQTSVKKSVQPLEEPFTLEAEVYAKQVLLNISITYDIQPPPNLPPCTVTLVTPPPLQTKLSVVDQNRIKPGGYKLEIQRPGYYGGPSQDIYIEPSEAPYPISRDLKAKPRQLSFQMVDPKDGSLVPAHEILADGKKVGYDDLFQPGTEIELTAKFIKYKTATSRVKIEPGEGPFIAPITLERLVKRDVLTARSEEIYDGIKYPYILYEDTTKIEAHHLISESGGGTRVLYTLWTDSKSQKLRVVAGYMYTEKPISNPGSISTLNSISIEMLLEHLETKKKSGSTDTEILDIVSKLLQRPNTSSMLKANNKDNQKLIDWLKNNITDSGVKARLDTVTKTLESFIK